MRLTHERIDSWIIKGFEGGANLVLDRSDKPISSENLKILKEVVEQIEYCLAKHRNIGETDNDYYLFKTLQVLAAVLFARAKMKEELPDQDKLNQHFDKLRVALKRYEGYVP